MRLQRLALEVFNKPLLIEPTKLETIVKVMESAMFGNLEHYTDRERSQAGYEVVNGVGIVNVSGALVHKASWLDAMSGLTGYDMLSNALDMALSDAAVNQIALILDTPGGHASGAFDLSDRIYNARGAKPITAIVSDMAYSAGYLIASAADEVVVSRTAGVGSVGVVMAHTDLSKAAEDAGINVTYIYSGDHKVDGNPYEPLPADVKARFQDETDSLYQLFVETVARNRNLSTQEVINTQALTYIGKKGIDIGFADRLSAEQDELARLFSQSLGGSRQTTLTMQVNTMSDENLVGPTADEMQAAVKQAEEAGYELGLEDGTSRCLAIMQAGEHAPKLAKQLAANLKLTAEDAQEILSAATPEKQASSLDAEMAGTNPNIVDDLEIDPKLSIGQSWASAMNKVKGVA